MVASLDPVEELLLMLRRQVTAGRQGLPFAEERDRVGVKLLQLLDPALKPSRRTGLDRLVHPCGEPEVGVGVLPME